MLWGWRLGLGDVRFLMKDVWTSDKCNPSSYYREHQNKIGNAYMEDMGIYWIYLNIHIHVSIYIYENI